MLACKNLLKDIENVISQSHVATWQLRHKHLRIFYHLCVTMQHLGLRNKASNAQLHVTTWQPRHVNTRLGG
jgi:Co/Zn/Cd efflux system component